MLKQTLKLTLYDKNPYNIKGRDQKSYTGVIYEGFDKDGKSHRFTSEKESYPVFDTGRYQEENARDIVLYGRTTLEGIVKWSDFQKEKKNLDKDFSAEEEQEFLNGTRVRL